VLNTKIAKAGGLNGKLYAFAKRRVEGCMVYGPYEHREAGTYQVAFELAIFDQRRTPKFDQVVATIEVVNAKDDLIIEKRDISLSEISGAVRTFVLDTVLNSSTILEYRVNSTGIVNLAAGMNPAVTRLGNTPPIDDLQFVTTSKALHEEVRAIMRVLHPYAANAG
jgi:hypothetical protein